MARKSGFVRRNNRMVRETLWFSGTFASTTIAAANGAVLITSLNAAALALRPFTIIRTRGSLSLTSDQTAATEGYSCGYGACVVSDQASAIGITAVPTPVTDSGSDLFLVFETLHAQFTFISGVGTMLDGVPNHPIDSKAMRKVEDGQDLIEVVESSGISSGLNLKSFSRSLIKLH